MASPVSGVSSASSLLQNSGGSEQDLERKRKRMVSNRESARRSRMRKEKHLNDVMAQVNQLKNDNSQLITTLALTTQNYYCVEAENNVLRTQMFELSNRLESLNEMLLCFNANNNMNYLNTDSLLFEEFISPWNNLSYVNLQPIMASADIMYQC